MDASKSRRFNKKALKGLKDREVGYFDGMPPAVENYDTWLRRQPVNVQLRHLHNDENKLALFQSGKLSLDKFTTAKGNSINAATLRRLGVEAAFRIPTRQSKYQPALNHYLKVDAYRVDDLIVNAKARQQLRKLFLADAEYTVSPLSTTDYKGILKDTKRTNRLKADGCLLYTSPSPRDS